MMRSHGMIGRSYAGKVKQIITGSVGLTIGNGALRCLRMTHFNLRKLVYEMRFDEVSARYGEFGSFYVGSLLSERSLEDMLKL